jgi:hypothetical protein
METQTVTNPVMRPPASLSRELQHALPASNFCFLISARFSGLIPRIYVLLVLDFPAILKNSLSFWGKPRTCRFSEEFGP